MTARSALLVATLAMLPFPVMAEGSQAPAAPIVDPLVTEGVVDAPVAALWSVFSTAEGYKRLGVAKAELDLRPGGTVRSAYDPNTPLDGEGAIWQQILAYEPQRMIAFRIARPPKGFPFMEAYKSVWSVVTLADLGDGRTNVRIAMVGWTPDAESQAMREFFRTGNDWVMKKLQSSYGAPAPTRPAHAADPLDPVDVQTTVPTDRGRVWKALATPEGWKAFTGGAQLTIGNAPGGPCEVWWNPDAPAGERGSEGCTLLALVPNEVLSFTWNAPPKFPFARTKHTWVVVTLEPLAPNSTRVRLRELGFRELADAHPDHRQEFVETRAYFQNAWARVLDALKKHFE